LLLEVVVADAVSSTGAQDHYASGFGPAKYFEVVGGMEIRDKAGE
jgi:hypothetical protein